MSKTFKWAFLTLITVIFYGSIAFAVPGAGVQINYAQPNGETFKASVNGDEKYNWVTSETGEVIVQDKDKYWKYAETIKGKIQPSKYKYSKTGQRPIEVIKNKDLILMIKKQPNLINSPISGAQAAVTTGQSTQSQAGPSLAPASSQKILVILTEFTNQNIRYSEAQWSNSFFGSTGSSVNSYYNEVSGGKFGFTPAEETAGTANDGVIKVKLNYAHPNTAGNTGSANQKIVTDALAAADPYINYASFDKDGDKYMDPDELHIVTVVAGYEAAYGGASPSVWAHKWSVYTTIEGIRFSEYTQEGEVHYDHMATIGVLAHELGHDLGLPDLYDYDGSSNGVGIHSIMAGGSWASQSYAGDSPTHFDAWSKIKLGYVTPTIVDSTGNFTVNSFNTGNYNVIKVPTSNSKQYFLVENRQNAGFDKGLANSVRSWGLAIWHIDESILSSNYWRPNDNEARKGVDLEEANEGSLGYSQLDKRYSGNFYHYFSSPSYKVFGPSTTPNTNLYEGTKTNISISTNDASSNSMNINVSLVGAEIPPQISSVSVDVNPFVPAGTNNATISYTLSKDANVTIGIYDAANRLVKTIDNNTSKIKGNLTAVWDGKNTSGTIAGDGVYTFKITAVDNLGLSASPVNGNITVEAAAPVITGVSDTPDPYTAALNTVSTISYTLSENANVNIKVFDANGNLVKTLVNGQVTSGVKTITWNGKSDAGKPAQNGVYTYKINAVDSFGKAAQEVSGTITIDRGAPITLTLYGHKPDPTKFDSKITYSTTQAGYVRLTIYDSNNNVVRNLLNNANRAAGTYYTTWTGRNNSNAAVPSGTYKYVIEAEDFGGNISGPFNGTITIDRSGPEISSLAVSPSPFVPNGDNTAAVSYDLGEYSKVTVNVYNSANTLIKTLINNAWQSAGKNTLTWNGKDKNEQFVTDGNYTIKVSGYDTLGNRSETKSISVIVDRNSPSIDDVTDSPDPLRVGDGQLNTIKYTLSENARVTINIYDNTGTLIKSLLNADTLAGNRQVTWDGKNNSGLSVANGTYTYKINAVDASGKAAAERVGTITTDSTPVIISNNSINPATFNPSGIILYTISEDAKVTVKILNSSNQEIRTLENNVQKGSGSYSVSWDGKNSSGTDVVSGTYKYRITATDLIGFNAAPVEGSITLVAPDKDAPRITAVTDAPDPLKLGAAGAGTTISYTLSENANVNIKIYNSSNTLVRTLVNSNLASGQRTVEWDGKDSSGVLVADGIYTYKINATDGSGNIGGEALGTITTDKTPVVISNVNVSPNKFTISGNINYTLSENAKVTLTIYDDQNVQVNTLLNAASKSAGAQSTLWDGRDSNGFDVQSGTYTYVITAIDNVGFITNVQGTVAVEGPAPVISNLSTTPEPFIPAGTNSVTIGYSMTSNAKVTLKIYDSNNNLVKTVLNPVNMLRGSNTAYWNGKNEAGNIVADGIYTYKINAVDSIGKASNEAVGTINIDKTAPKITTVTAAPNPFGTGSTTTISYTLSENAKVTVKILDSQNRVLKVLEDNVAKNAGANSIKWDGKDTNGTFITGTSVYTITVVDNANFTASANGSVTCIDSSKPVISNVIDSPDPFAPNGTNTITIGYSISKDANVSIKIYNENNTLVKTIMDNLGQLKGNNSVWWNGKDNANAIVADGVYTYKINAVDALGTSADEVAGTFGVGAALTITNDSISKDPFTANGTSTVSIVYTLSKKANVDIKIMDSTNSLVKTLFSGQVNSGVNTVTWDGKNSDENIVSDGNYKYKIEAMDTLKQVAVTTKPFVVVGSSPEITNINDTPDPFKADGTFANINYTLSKNSLVTIEIFDSNNVSVKKILNNAALIKGLNVAFWDGKNSNGTVVNDGVYTYKITVTDSYSKETVQGSGTITVEKFPPAGNVKDISINPNPFAPNGGTNATISYGLTADAYVTISIIDSNNAVVKTLQNNILKTAGSYNLSWDGKASSGSTVSDGIYTLQFKAVNGLGVGSTTTSGFTVERLTPVISEVTDAPNPFKPDGINLWALNFNLSEDANVYLEVKNSANSVVWTARPVIFTKGKRSIELYGTNDNGVLLNDGTYTYKLYAVDFYGKTSNIATGTLNIDKTAPVITNNTANPSTFTTSTTISYNLSENAKVTVTISSGNTVIKTLENEVAKAAGANTVTWDGKDNQGITVDSGNYTYTITAKDAVGLTAKVSGNIIKDGGNPVINNVSDSVDPFKPSGANYTTISYSINKNAFVSIKIYDNGGSLVKTLLNNFSAGKGNNSANWDGRNDSGAVVADGIYTYRISAIDTLGNSAVQVGGTVTIDKTAPVISDFMPSQYPFVPTGSNTLIMSYNISEAAKVTLELMDMSNTLIGVIENGTDKTKGSNRTNWNGMIDGTIVDDDIYTIRITAVDSVGNSSTFEAYIGVDRYAPQIVRVDDEPDPFNPKQVDFSTIHGELSEWFGEVNAAIYDSNNTKIKEVDMDEIMEFWWGWSGTDSNENLVKDGVYTYKVNGADLFGKKAQEAKGEITIDSSVPEITGLKFTPELENPRGTISYNLSKTAKINIAIYDNSNNLLKQLDYDVQRNSGSNSAYWDGTANGKLIGYGVYTFKITAVGLNGANALPQVGVITFETIDPDFIDNTVDDNIGEDTNNQPSQSTTDKSIPVISNTNYVGSPSGVLSYAVSKKVKVTTVICDSSNGIIRVLEDNVLKEAGKYTVAWNGQDYSGLNVPIGNYYYKITAVDMNGKAAIPVTGDISVKTNSTNNNSSNSNTGSNNSSTQSSTKIYPVISNVSISPSKFAPTGIITYTLSKPAKVTITLYNRTLNPIRVLENNVQKNIGQNITVWDGKDAQGFEVDDIIYTYRINAVDSDGLAAVQVSGTISMAPKAFDVTAVSVSPKPYNPKGQAGGLNPVTVTYSLTTTAKVSASIYTADGKFISTIRQNALTQGGINTLTWDGNDNSGFIVSSGIYECRITAISGSGKQKEASISIIVEKR